MRLGEVRIQRECAFGRSTGFCHRLFFFFRRDMAETGDQVYRRGREFRVGEGVTRIEPYRLLVVADRLAEIVGGAQIEMKISLQKGVVSLDILRRGRGGQLRSLPVVPQQRDLEL